MGLRSTRTFEAISVVALAFAGAVAGAASWGSETLKMNPGKSEAVAYDQSGCTAPGAQGYFAFIAKFGVSYTSVGWFNDKASCITIGPHPGAHLSAHQRQGLDPELRKHQLRRDHAKRAVGLVERHDELDQGLDTAVTQEEWKATPPC